MAAHRRRVSCIKPFYTKHKISSKRVKKVDELVFHTFPNRLQSLILNTLLGAYETLSLAEQMY